MFSELLDSYLTSLDEAVKKEDPNVESKSLLNRFVSIVEKRLGHPINIFKVDMDSEKLRGVLLNKEDQATILVSKDLNRDWTRFVVAKELAHLYLDLSKKEKFNEIGFDNNILFSKEISFSNDRRSAEVETTILALAFLLYERTSSESSKELKYEDEVFNKYKELIPQLAAEVKSHIKNRDKLHNNSLN